MGLIASSNTKNEKINFTQAELMISFLQHVSAGKVNPGMIDAILETRGMDLIIEQQNRRAKVNKAQYHKILSHLLDKDAPDLDPVDSSERAKLGVKRLKQAIWLYLKWGVKNGDLLKKRLIFLKDLNIAFLAKKKADLFLPEPLVSIPEIYVVAGGKAGFAASENCIYMDLLNMSYSKQDAKPLIESEIIDYFAHEMHHVGFHKLSHNLINRLKLDEVQKVVYGFVAGLVAEGSATYLINGHQDFSSIKNNRRYIKYFNLEKGLLEICEGVLHSIFNGNIQGEDDFSLATKELLGMGYHAAGSQMIHVIDQAEGVEAIMKILKDPRLFFIKYNEAAKRLMAKPGTHSYYLFKKKLVNTIKNLGQ